MRTLLIVALLLLSLNAHSQEYSMYWNTYSLFNPAASGLHQRVHGVLTGNFQYVGFEDAPVTKTAVFDMKTDALHGGIGINYTYDKIGLTKGHNVALNYNYQLDLQNESKLSLGVSGGIMTVKTDFSSLYLLRGGSDPVLETLDVKFSILNLKFGLFYTTNHWDIGIGSSHYSVIKNQKNVTISPKNIFSLVSAYRFDLGENLSLKPHLLLTTSDLKKYTMSSNLMLILWKQFWTGISYKLNSSYGVVAGVDFWNVLRVGYSLEIPTSSISKYSYRDHEIILALNLK